MTRSQTNEAKAYQKAYYEANKERLKAYQKALREADPEADRAKQRARRAANIEAVNARDRARWQIRKDDHNAKRVEKAAALRETGVKRAFDPIMNRIYRSNRRALERNAPGRHTKPEILSMLEAQGFKCVYCPADLRDGYHKDHIKALARGGSNDIGNIQLTCAKCNQSKHAMDVEKFLATRNKELKCAA